MMTPHTQHTADSDKVREARDKLVIAACRWRKADADDDGGVKRLLLCVNALAAAVDNYEKARERQ